MTALQQEQAAALARTLRQESSAAAMQDDARQTYRQSITAGVPLSGLALGDLYDRSERWGRERIAEVKAGDAQNADIAAAAIPSSQASVARNGEFPAMGNSAVSGNFPAAAAGPLPRQRGGSRAAAHWVARLAFALGICASTAANIAHARPELGPRLASAFAPLALVLAVELAARVPWRPGWQWTAARWLGTGLVAAVTAVVSYRHQVDLLAGGYGEDVITAAILPLSVDGLMVTAAAALLSLGRNPGPDA